MGRDTVAQARTRTNRGTRRLTRVIAQYELTARRKRDVVEPGAGLAVEFLPAGIQLLWLAVRESSLDEKYRGLWIVAEGHRFHELDTIAEVPKAEALDLVDRRAHELATIRGL